MAAPTHVVVVPNCGAFDQHSVRYKCCCNSCHVKTGAMIIGVLETIGFVIGTIGVIYQMAAMNAADGKNSGSLGTCIVYGVTLALFFWGWSTERAGLLIPHMILQIINIVVMFILGIVAIVALTAGTVVVAAAASSDTSSTSSDKTDTQAAAGAMAGLSIGFLIIFILVAALEIWFFLIVLGCYRYFRDQQYHRSVAPNPLVQSYYPVQYTGPAMSYAPHPQQYANAAPAGTQFNGTVAAPAPYPTQQYPTQQYPTQQYPTQQYPTQQYPTQQYPTQQYPTQQYPTGTVSPPVYEQYTKN